MPKKPRSDMSLGSLLKKAGIKKKALKSKTGRSVRKDAKLGTLRKRSQ